MPSLESEVRELNTRMSDLVHEHAATVLDHFAVDSAVTRELRAARVYSVGDLLAIPPALLPQRALEMCRRHHAAFCAAVSFLHQVRFGGSWERLADAMGVEAAVRPYLNAGRPPKPTRIARPDVVIAGDRIVMAEPNFGTSAGAQEEADVVGRMFDRAPVIGERLKQLGARREDTVRCMADMIRTELEAAGRRGDGLVVVTEFGCDLDRFHVDGLARELRRYGVRAVAHATENLQAEAGRVTVFGHRVDLIYRLAAEQPDPESNFLILKPLLDAGRAGHVVMLDDVADQIAGHKTIMALVSETMADASLPAGIRADLEGFVPFSRVVRDGPIILDDQRVGLLDFCVSRQQDLVLKPGPGHLGRGVTIGEEISSSDWIAVLEQAVTAEEFWLVQDLARSSRATVSVVREDGLYTEDNFVDYSYFAVGDGVPTAGLRKHPPVGKTTRRVKRCGIGPVYFV
ncbi:hypothetical protein [Streptomyces eurythermus]|uniref:hypothetical protein n=1 Tax=Streptomyces eurythermus TaxID=42237 RepID=UPI003405F0B4